MFSSILTKFCVADTSHLFIYIILFLNLTPLCLRKAFFLNLFLRFLLYVRKLVLIHLMIGEVTCNAWRSQWSRVLQVVDAQSFLHFSMTVFLWNSYDWADDSKNGNILLNMPVYLTSLLESSNLYLSVTIVLWIASIY